ncbi:MAG: helix-turn-helix transcriptional regulator [Ruminococcaceae bacterium]|nr:helix-turn-helix transcriptional regulator [Oscillospiraceae bacterium]
MGSGVWVFLLLNLILRVAIPVVIAVLLIKALLKYLNSDKKGDKIIKKSLGEVIRKHREEKGFTQEYMAEQLGISRQAVSKWENGVTEPSTSNLFALAKLFDMTIEDFMKEIQQ